MNYQEILRRRPGLVIAITFGWCFLAISVGEHFVAPLWPWSRGLLVALLGGAGGLLSVHTIYVAGKYLNSR